MAEIQWIKLKVDMFDNEKIKLIEAMPDADSILVIWIKLLTYAGKANSSGYILLTETIPMNEEELATIFNRPLNTIRYALQIFERYGMVERENDAIRIKNWDTHQNVEGMDKIREQNRLRKQRQRKKEKEKLPEPSKKELSHVKSRDSHATEEEGEEELDRELDKEREEEKKESEYPAAAQTYFENNIGYIKENIVEDLKFYSDKFDETDAIIIEALDICIARGKKSWGYAKSIIQEWKSEELKTLKDVRAYEKEKKQGFSKNKNNLDYIDGL